MPTGGGRATRSIMRTPARSSNAQHEAQAHGHGEHEEEEQQQSSRHRDETSDDEEDDDDAEGEGEEGLDAASFPELDQQHQQGFQEALNALEQVNKDLHDENGALRKELNRKDKVLRKRELTIRKHGESIMAMMASHQKQRDRLWLSCKTAQKVRSHRDRLARKVPTLKEQNRALLKEVAELKKLHHQQAHAQAASSGDRGVEGGPGAAEHQQDALRTTQIKLETATTAYKRQKELTEKAERQLQEAHLTITKLRASKAKLESEKQQLAKTLASRQRHTVPGAGRADPVRST